LGEQLRKKKASFIFLYKQLNILYIFQLQISDNVTSMPLFLVEDEEITSNSSYKVFAHLVKTSKDENLSAISTHN
jgi:hypothetical protein